MAKTTVAAVAARLDAHEKHCDERHEDNKEQHAALGKDIKEVLGVVKNNSDRAVGMEASMANFFGDEHSHGDWQDHKKSIALFHACIEKTGRYIIGAILVLAFLHLQKEIGLVGMIKEAL